MAYTIIVKQGNMLDEKHAIFAINASNTQLILGSGVSMAFKTHCGRVLQNEMSEKLKEIGKLKKGDVVLTSSGEAKNIRGVLHAAITDYNKGVKESDKLPKLEEIHEVLKEIEWYIQWYLEHFKNESIKIVLPLLGCGVGKLEKIKVIELYKNFFTRKVNFDCEIVVYGYSREDFEEINNSL